MREWAWDVATGALLMTLPASNVRHAKFGEDGASIVTYCDGNIARSWDATFTVGLRDESLVKVAARDKLRGEELLTDAELLVLRPILGDNVERGMVRRITRLC